VNRRDLQQQKRNKQLILSFPSFRSDYPLFSFCLSVSFSLLVAGLVDAPVRAVEAAVEMGWLSGQGGGETVSAVGGELHQGKEKGEPDDKESLLSKGRRRAGSQFVREELDCCCGGLCSVAGCCG
jgi:hypothetical protein